MCSKIKLKNKYNLCSECYKINKKDNLNFVKISSGLDNIADWIEIFSIKKYYMDNGYNSFYYYQYFCNLNKNSPHYKKFACQSYREMLGDIIKIIDKTSLEEIISIHNK